MNVNVFTATEKIYNLQRWIIYFHAHLLQIHILLLIFFQIHACVRMQIFLPTFPICTAWTSINPDKFSTITSISSPVSLLALCMARVCQSVQYRKLPATVRPYG